MILTQMQFPLPAPKVGQGCFGSALSHNHLIGLHRESRKQQRRDRWSENCTFKHGATANPVLPLHWAGALCVTDRGLCCFVMYQSQALQ